MNPAHIILSASAAMRLACSGIATGWLKLWLLSAGADHVSIRFLEETNLKEIRGWQLIIASEAELMRVAVTHGKHIRIGDDGRNRLVGADSFALIDPDRAGWHYELREKGDMVVLLPEGDVVWQREKWLSIFLGNRFLLPAQIWIGEEGGIELEPGLRGQIADLLVKPAHPEFLMNDSGLLPEEQVLFELNRHGWGVRFAESCTGGGMAERMSRIPGASEVLDSGWITYSNDAKHRLLKVPRRLLARYGAVSRETAEAMAGRGRDRRKHACLAITGIAGPGGGSEEKPVGTVWIAVATPDGGISSRCLTLSGSRSEIRTRSILGGMALLISILEPRI